MTLTKKMLLLSLSACFAAACGGNNNSNADATVSPTYDAPPTQYDAPPGPPDAGGPPAMPALGAEIDRIGRPAISTALIAEFQTDATMRGAKKDAYNADANVSDWATNWTSEIQKNLAIYDGLDANCGNQLLADKTSSRYSFLAGVLADDRLYVNIASTTCQQYLGVEANAVGITNSDCGGRTPTEDVIDTSYSVLATGQLTGVTDGVDKDADGTYDLTNFPFLLPPQ